MKLTINKVTMISSSTSGSIIKSSSNAIIGYTKAAFFDIKGVLSIKGNGQIIGSANPTNIIPDTLSLLIINPLINQSSKLLLTKTFIDSGVFSFEIELNINTAMLFSKFEFNDNTSIINNSGTGLNITGMTLYAIELTNASGLYQFQIDNVYSKYEYILPK